MLELVFRVANENSRTFDYDLSFRFDANEDYHDRIPEHWKVLVALLDAVDVKATNTSGIYVQDEYWIEGMGWKNVGYNTNDHGDKTLTRIEYYKIPHLRHTKSGFIWFKKRG